MGKESMYVLPVRTLNFLINEIMKRDQEEYQRGFLVTLIYRSNPGIFRDLFRAIVRATFATGDKEAAGRLSRDIVQAFDRVSAQERHEKEMRELCG